MAYSYARIERLHYHSYLTYYIFKRSKCFGDRFIVLLSEFLESRLNVSNLKDLVRDVIYVSLVLHDIGKAYRGYQKVLYEYYGETRFSYHELLSSLITYSHLRNYVTKKIRDMNVDSDTKRKLGDYLILSATIAVLMHHEALRNYIDVLTKLKHDMVKFLSRVVREGFIKEEVILIDKILEFLGIKGVRLGDVISELISKGFQRRYDSLRRSFLEYSRSPCVEYLVTNTTAAIQLCDRLAASITRGSERGWSLRRLEREFMRYCLDIHGTSINECLVKLKSEAAHELRRIVS